MIQSELYSNIKINTIGSVETNQIKRIELADAPVGDGANGSTIIFAFKERYFEKYDIFKMDRTLQQFFVVSRPVRRADKLQ